MRRVFPLLLVVMAACGGDAAPTGTVAAVTTTAPASGSTAVSEPAATAASSGPTVVLGVVSGRGDDQSFEVSVWLDGPVTGADRLVVGIDSDDSYSGSGDPTPHLEGWFEIGEQVTVGAHGSLVAGGSSAAISDWLSWGADGDVLRVFFIRDVAAVAGTLWVVVGSNPGPGGIAGVEAGEACSVRGTDLAPDPGGEVPDAGRPCRYP